MYVKRNNLISDLSSHISTIILESFFCGPISRLERHTPRLWGDFGPHPYPSPEHIRLFLVEMSAGEGFRMAKNRLSEKEHPLNLFFFRFLGKCPNSGPYVRKKLFERIDENKKYR
jgi:hypothetical protein